MKDIWLSVVIPVYNVKSYLAECMESLSDNSGRVEWILVDDGSEDGSGELCDSYQNHPAVTVIHQANAGLSAARNTGLLAAVGKYVLFVDADDTMTAGSVGRIAGYLGQQHMDVLLFDAEADGSMYYVHDGLEEQHCYTGTECIAVQLRKRKDYPTTVWLGAYRREFLLAQGFYFEPGLLHEDELWTQRVLIQARQVYYLPEKLYHYRRRCGSITDTAQKDLRPHIRDLQYIFSVLLTELDAKIPDRKLRRRMQANIVRRYLHMIARMQVWRYPELERQIDKKSIRHYAAGTDRCRALILTVSTRLYGAADALLRHNKRQK